MKINPSDILNSQLLKKITTTEIKTTNIAELNASLVKKSAEIETNAEKAMQGAEISASYSRAELNIIKEKDLLVNSIKNILNKHSLIAADEHIHRAMPNSGEGVMRLKIGDEIKGFKGLYNDNKNACAYFTPNGHPDKIFIKNQLTGTVDVLDCTKQTLTTYSKSDVEALKYYKYHPDAIHSRLRNGKDIYSGSFKAEMVKVIEDLTKLFQDKTKVFTTNEDTTLYRALEANLSEADIQKLSTLGEIFNEKSFCSTTKGLNVAQMFCSGNPILKIEFPKGSEYIDIEKIFNIDRQHWREAEFLLDKNSKFMVTGFDKTNNIINVKYLGKE